MYELLRKDYYWPHMASDVYNTVNKYSQSQQMGIKFKLQRQLERFSPAGPLKFVSIEIVGPLQRPKSGNQFAVIIADEYSKFTKATRTSKINSTQIAHSFSYDWVMPYGISNVILSYSGEKFISRSFTLLATYLEVKYLTAILFRPHINEQIGRYNKTFVSRSSLYTSDKLRN